MIRPSWHERMEALARQWASYSTCLKRKVGAVIYDPDSKAVLGLGYNDTPIGAIDCGDGGCLVCEEPIGKATLRIDCGCCHAEMNAVVLAARRGVALEGARLVIWSDPPTKVCLSCSKYLTQAGITW